MSTQVRYSHTALFKTEIVEWCVAHSYRSVIDATCGEGGHSYELVKNGINVIAYDYDSAIQQVARARTQRYAQHIRFVNKNFSSMENETSVDAVLFDVGISMWHYQKSGRGFSYEMHSEPFDMRSDSTAQQSAREWIMNSTEHELTQVLEKNGEVMNAKNIAHKLKTECTAGGLQTVGDVTKIAGANSRQVLQALRIEVNNEIISLRKGLEAASRIAKSAVITITFHSLEDRTVKQFFKALPQWSLAMHKKHREYTFAPSAQLRIYKR